MSQQHAEKVASTITDLFQEAQQLGDESVLGTFGGFAKGIGTMIGLLIPSEAQGSLIMHVVKSIGDGVIEGKQLRGDKDSMTMVVGEMPINKRF